MLDFVSANPVVLVALQYAVSFFIFGWLCRGWREDDKANKRERFWLVKYYWHKIVNKHGE